MEVFNIPNSLTMLRLVLIPAFVIALMYGRNELALYIFFVAAVSDSLDGVIARLKDQKTELGAILDPIADKIMLITSFVLFAYFGWIPTWLTILVISRDLAVVSGWMAVYLTTRGKLPGPSWIGKATILVEFVLICHIIINKNVTFLPEIYLPLIWLTATLVVISGLHYVYREMKIASEK